MRVKLRDFWASPKAFKLPIERGDLFVLYGVRYLVFSVDTRAVFKRQKGQEIKRTVWISYMKDDGSFEDMLKDQMVDILSFAKTSYLGRYPRFADQIDQRIREMSGRG